jgi:hypothetical protein
MVMSDKNQRVRQWISFRLKPEEYSQIDRRWKETTCRNLSEYARKVLLSKPVVIRYRNQSADQFLSEMILLKKELNAIGNNFNQSVKRLHAMDKVTEIRSWAILNESTKRSFMNKIVEIENRLEQIYQLWSQK